MNLREVEMLRRIALVQSVRVSMEACLTAMLAENVYCAARGMSPAYVDEDFSFAMANTVIGAEWTGEGIMKFLTWESVDRYLEIRP